MTRWNFLLDDSINSDQSVGDTGAQINENEGRMIEEDVIEPALEVESSDESDTVSQVGIERIWSPPRIARMVRRIRAIGKGRIEEIWYRIFFGFNKDEGDYMCKQQHENCNVACTKEFCRNVNNDLMRCFNFRIEDIERVTAQIEMLQFFEQAVCKVSTCVAQSSALGNCREITGDNETVCFECWVDGRLEELLNTFKMLKISTAKDAADEKVNWVAVGHELDDIIFKIMEDKQSQHTVQWTKLAKVIRIFLIYLLNTELSAVLFQLVNEQGFYNEGELKLFLGGFEKGKLFHTIETCKNMVKLRTGGNDENIKEAIMIKSKNKPGKPLSDSEEAFLIKNCQFIASMDSCVMKRHGAIMTNEIRTEKFVISDPLLMKWTEKVELKELNSLIAQLADLGVKVGREMEIKMGLPKGQDEIEKTEKGFGEKFWEGFYDNDDGSFGGGDGKGSIEFKPEPFRQMAVCNKRKLNHICLN